MIDVNVMPQSANRQIPLRCLRANPLQISSEIPVFAKISPRIVSMTGLLQLKSHFGCDGVYHLLRYTAFRSYNRPS